MYAHFSEQMSLIKCSFFMISHEFLLPSRIDHKTELSSLNVRIFFYVLSPGLVTSRLVNFHA